MTLPQSTIGVLRNLIYGDVEEQVKQYGESNRAAILETKAMLMELGIEHLEWLTPVLRSVWAEGYVRGYEVGAEEGATGKLVEDEAPNPYGEA